MDNYICVTCGIQFAATEQPPAECPICTDERQYIGHNGQQWTTVTAMQATHKNTIKSIEHNLTGIATTPKFGIGQRAALLQTSGGNVLWECVSLIDDETIEAIQALGGLRAITGSHPHLIGSLVEWSHAFGNVPIYMHAANRPWIMRPEAAIVYWDDDTFDLGDGLTLIHCGGHFTGSAVLHWPDGAEGRGALFVGDTMLVVADRRHVTFMYSYPNYIPLPASAVRQIVDAVEPYAFDRIYGGWFDSNLRSDAKSAVRHSAERYIRAISD